MMLDPRPSQTLHPRQIWGVAAFTRVDPSCTPITLPSAGVLSFGPDNVVTLTTDIIFTPVCTDSANQSSLATVTPFYASATPQVYVVAAATVFAWVLVIMLIISPRTFLNNRSAGPKSLLAGKGIIAGANGSSSSGSGMGPRPWLQKAAALTVAVALTIATADTFIVARNHYPGGIDGYSMRALVENSMEIRITKLISDIFVWLAQVQTLIRLFPRHKEKVVIKWIGFALIILDTVFSGLNSFYGTSTYRRPRDFVDAIPALCYLFELSLSLLYAAWVIYYAFTKRRYAFYHPLLKSNMLLSTLSLVSILTPVVFFVTDITLVSIAGWGDYFRWVGGAAASVVVWEWVERIELLERDEKKDGILGREIFDGDDMLESHPTGQMTYNAQRNTSFLSRRRSSGGDTPGSGGADGGVFHRFNRSFTTRIGRRFRTQRNAPSFVAEDRSHLSSTSKELALYASNEEELSSGSEPHSIPHNVTSISPAPHIIHPPSRTDTRSAASTVYVVRHDNSADVQPVRHRFATPDRPELQPPLEEEDEGDEKVEDPGRNKNGNWYAVANPFKRKRTSPPAEVRAAIQVAGAPSNEPTTSSSERLPADARTMRNLRHRLGGLAARVQPRSSDKNTSDVELPWTVIPAHPLGTTWSPSNAATPDNAGRHGSSSTVSTSASPEARDGVRRVAFPTERLPRTNPPPTLQLRTDPTPSPPENEPSDAR